jgi:4-amino-4-deoxy-L-arabinose transferase-like glycosyltransferase
MECVFNKLAARPQRSIVVLSLVLLLAGNWILPLTDRDEARFGEASREMLLRGDYIVPWFNDGWRLYKPVLIYWCQMASYCVLGVNDFAARLPSVLFTTATALLLVRWGRKIAEAKTGFMAGAMYVAGLHVGIIGRVATADLALFFFFTLATWSGWELTRPEQPRRKQWWWIFYVALALGFLAKGPEAWLPLGGMILGRALRKGSFRLQLSETVVGLCLAVALVALWGVPALVQTGGEFWSFGMGDQVFKRAIAVKDSHGMAGILGFVALLPLYFLTFFISFFPWSTRVPLALRRWWPERSRDDLGWYLLMVAALVFAVFSLVVTKLPHYTMPAFPCLALWLARQIGTDSNVSTWFSRRLAVMAVIVLSVTLVGFSLLKGHLLTENVWRELQPHVRPETRVGCFGYTEPSLVWRFRAVTTNRVTLASIEQAKNFLTNPPPLIIVLPTKDLAQFKDLNGPQIQVHGFDMVKFKNWQLTAILRP